MNPTKLIMWIGIIALVAALGYMVASPAGRVQKDIGDKELIDLVANGARLVDVRSPGEYGLGHIRGAVNVPVEQIGSAAASWDRNQPVVVYCATGARSADAAARLASMGFTKVYNHAGGTAAWGGDLTTEVTSSVTSIETAGKPLFVEFTSDG